MCIQSIDVMDKEGRKGKYKWVIPLLVINRSSSPGKTAELLSKVQGQERQKKQNIHGFYLSVLQMYEPDFHKS